MLGKLTCISICLFGFILPSITATPAGLQVSSTVRKELSQLNDYREATRAMADSLPSIATDKFRHILATNKLSSNAQAVLKLMLAESLIRSGIKFGDNEALFNEALKILADNNLATFPTSKIWRAEALANLGQYQEAEKSLSKVATNYALIDEAKLTRARLLIALDQNQAALLILKELNKSKKSHIRHKASLLSAELHIDSGKDKFALEALKGTDTENPATAQLKIYLTARLALLENKPKEATNLFESLIGAPNHLSSRMLHATFLGLSDAQAADKNTETAILTLQQFIDDYPDSHALQAAFERLLSLLPGKIAEDNPIKEKFHQWSGQTETKISPVLLNPGDGASSTPITKTNTLEYYDRAALSLYYYAKLLARSNEPANLSYATATFSQLRNLYSNSTQTPSNTYQLLFSASLLETAAIQLKQNNPDQAAFTLAAMEKITFSPKLKNQSSILRGEILASKDDYENAMKAFQAALLSNSDIISEAASINAGIMALKSSNLLAFDAIIDASKSSKIKTSLTLERALWKCDNGDIQGRNELEAFIMASPKHPRENEARLALAATCVETTPADITLAKAQLDIISLRMQTAAEQAQITRIRIRAESLLKNWLAAAQVAKNYLTKFENSPQAAFIQFKYAEAHYHNQDFNEARRIFQSFEQKYPENTLNPYAKFYAAMAARLEGTAQSREECINMFQKIIDSKHPLAAEARVQQSRILIDTQRYEEAEKSLSPLLAETSSSATKLGAGVLMADCLQRQGNNSPEKIKQAIEIYNTLLTIKDITPAWNHRIHYLRGQAHESLQQTSEAFKSYYQVIINEQAPDNRDNKHEEWFWFYRCGFKALTMLENAKRWEASVKLAKRIASFNGPRKEEADKRAKELARTHMIWSEDELVPKTDTE